MEAVPNRHFSYTGIRVRDIDKAIEFFTNILGMTLISRIDATWNKGIFANLQYENDSHYLELNWYANDSPYYAEFEEGEQLDHLGINIDLNGFDSFLMKLDQAGYPIKKGPIQIGKSKWAFVRAYEGIWLDISCHVED